MKKILSLLLIVPSLFSMQLDLVNSDTKSKMYIEPCAVRVPAKLGSLDLYHGKKGFYVRQDGEKHTIKKYFTDPMLRNITKRQLQAFLEAGYLSINQMDDGEYSLKAKGRIVGGGPLLGAAAYWITKSLCYGTVLAATTTVVVTTAGVGVAAVTGAAAAGTGIAVAGTIATPTIVTGVGVASAATSVAIAGTGGTLVAGAITGASAAGATVAGVTLVNAATLTTAAGVTVASTTGAAATIGTGAACVAGIETLSAAVGTFFGMLPTP